MSAIPDLFIVGTDTAVGKTMVSLLLMQLLFAKGCAPFYLKPFQTGCEDAQAPESDARFIYAHTFALKDQDPAQSVIYCHREPKAPYFAARQTGRSIDTDDIRRFARLKSEQYSPLVIEGAGGLLVPVTGNLMMVDIIKETASRPLLVARAGLGTINHTLLSIEAMRSRQVEPLAVVFVDAGIQPTEGDLAAENIEAVERFGGVKVLGIIGHISDYNSPPGSVYEVLGKVFT